MPATTSIDNGTKVEFIPLNKISEDGDNVRTEYDQAELEELAASILNHGLIQPITVYGGPDVPNGDGSYAVYMGHRRYRALRYLSETKQIKASEPIRCIVDNDSITGGAINSTGTARMLIENLQRVDLSAIDEAKGYQAMIEQYGYTQRDLAKEVGKSAGHIAKRVALLALPDELRARVQDSIDIDTAYRISKLDGDQIEKIRKGFESGKFTFNNIAYEVMNQEHTLNGRRRKEALRKALDKAMLEPLKELPADIHRDRFERVGSYGADDLKEYVPKKNHVQVFESYADRITVYRQLTPKQLEAKQAKQAAEREKFEEEAEAEEAEWLENEATDQEKWDYQADELRGEYREQVLAFERAVREGIGEFIVNLEPKKVTELLIARVASDVVNQFSANAKRSCIALGINAPTEDEEGNEISEWDLDWNGTLLDWIGQSTTKALQAWLAREVKPSQVADFDVLAPLREALAEKGAVVPEEPDYEAILGERPADDDEDDDEQPDYSEF